MMVVICQTAACLLVFFLTRCLVEWMDKKNLDSIREWRTKEKALVWLIEWVNKRDGIVISHTISWISGLDGWFFLKVFYSNDGILFWKQKFFFRAFKVWLLLLLCVVSSVHIHTHTHTTTTKRKHTFVFCFVLFLLLLWIRAKKKKSGCVIQIYNYINK